jgi:hypothetical protein
LDWRSIWDYPPNASLKRLRQDPNVLAPGDVLQIPEKTLKGFPASTDKRHTFRLKGTPAQLCLRLVDQKGRPRANLRYVLTVDGCLLTGTTDSDGKLQENIRPSAQRARLEIQAEAVTERYELPLGHLDPVTEDRGVIQRLCNLGYDCGDEAEVGENTSAALLAFQRRCQLQETGHADDATRARLRQEHGS